MDKYGKDDKTQEAVEENPRIINRGSLLYADEWGTRSSRLIQRKLSLLDHRTGLGVAMKRKFPF
jgi:hypothetical protein